jgi:hypothetical protein
MEHKRGHDYSIRRGILWKGAWRILVVMVGMAVAGCSGQNQNVAPRNVNYYQKWSLQPGDNLAGYRVHSGLGDISVQLEGKTLFMPFDGTVQPQAEKENLCLILSSPEVPAYLFRLCGVENPKLGDRNQGDPIGNGDIVAFAAMRRQADGTWAMVEPAKELIEQFLVKAP